MLSSTSRWASFGRWREGFLEAKSFYATTLQIDPQHERAFTNLGLLALEEQRYGLAESFFRHSIEVDPRNAKTHFLIAKALLAKGDRDSARGEVEVAIALHPDQREFKDLRGEITSGVGAPLGRERKGYRSCWTDHDEPAWADCADR